MPQNKVQGYDNALFGCCCRMSQKAVIGEYWAIVESLLTRGNGRYWNKNRLQRLYRYLKYITSVIGWLMNMEQLVEWKMAGETEVLRENLPQCICIHHKSHMTWPKIETGPQLCYARAASAISSTTSPTWGHPRLKLRLRGEKPSLSAWAMARLCRLIYNQRKQRSL
jgi:hypothetical protein